jgi:hypothetical protein
MKAFRAAVEAKDLEAATALLADDVVFHSPAVHKPYEGKAITSMILRAVLRVLEDFRYEREIGAEDSPDSVLVFRAQVGAREVQGIDLLHLNDDGLIDDFTVMIRPLSALNAVAEAMGVEIQRVMAEGAEVPS